MKTLILLVSSYLLLNAKSCDKTAVAGTPECILEMIAGFKAAPVQKPAASVYQYDYHGQKVYYVTAPCCDQFNKLYSADCNLICHPDGGITGKGDGKCPDFNQAKSNEVLIWKDDR